MVRISFFLGQRKVSIRNFVMKFVNKIIMSICQLKTSADLCTMLMS